jgi:hypothetical protein
MQPDEALIEHVLERLAGQDDAFRQRLFDRFFHAFPARRESFLAFGTSSRRMADETLQLLHGLAAGAEWVWPHIADLVDLHRAYGALPDAEYDSFIDLVAETACELGGASTEADAAWRRQASALKGLVRRAGADWAAALPR